MKINNRDILFWFLVVVFVAVYVNVGWMVATFYTNPIMKESPEKQTNFQRLANGPWDVKVAKDFEDSAAFVFLVILWPFILFVVIGLWLFYLCCYAIWIIYRIGLEIYHFLIYLLWLIFWGGAVKLLGWA
jgi:hypothetical protein